MAVELIFAPVRATDANGDAIPGALANFYESGTTTPITVYTTSSLDVAHANPVVADAGGHFPQVFHGGSPASKVVLTTAAAASVYTLDPCPAVGLGAGAASDIAFSPTVALPYTDAQSAIEGAAASAASGFIPYGLAVDGTAAQITDKDATTIPAGSYRTDTGTSAGAFPSGSVAADGGILTTWRRTAASAVEWFMPADKNKWFVRRLATTWQAFREIVTVPDTFADGGLITKASGLFTAVAIGSNGSFLRPTAGALAWGGGIFTSTDLTITSGGSIGTIAHGLGSAPDVIMCYLVCQTTADGYTAGQVVLHNGGYSSGPNSHNRGHAIRVDATNLTGRWGSYSSVYVMPNGSTGVATELVNSEWKLRIVAIKF